MSEMTFDQWGDRLDAIYIRASAANWPQEDRHAWDREWELMLKDFPHLALTRMDPKCGCCTLDDHALLAFDDPRGPGNFEILYPTFRPTHIFYLG